MAVGGKHMTLKEVTRKFDLVCTRCALPPCGLQTSLTYTKSSLSKSNQMS